MLSKSDHSFMFFNPAVIRNGALFVADCSGCFYQRTEKQICNLVLLSLSLVCPYTGSLTMRPQSTYYLTCTCTLPHAIPTVGTISLVCLGKG